MTLVRKRTRPPNRFAPNVTRSTILNDWGIGTYHCYRRTHRSSYNGTIFIVISNRYHICNVPHGDYDRRRKTR